MTSLGRLAEQLLLSRVVSFLAPTPTTLLFNQLRLAHPLKVPKLPEHGWAEREAREVLRRSEERLRSIETKGPGLATANAVVGAGVLLALSDGWATATCVGRALLVAAAVYAALSLIMPIYLVGQQRRGTIDVAHLLAADGEAHPERYLAEQALEAAQYNARRTQRLGNLQDAARGELARALALLLAWALLGPVAGVVA